MGGAQSTDGSAQRAAACTDGTDGVPRLGDGRVAHLSLRAGELAPRIVSVGSLGRAQRLCELLDREVEVFELRAVQARAIVSGPMAIVRYGSCRGLTPAAVPGTVVVNTAGSVSVTRNPDAFPQPRDRESEGGASGAGSRASGGDADAYRISRPVPPDPSLARALGEAMETAVGSRRTVEGLNVSCDSFYSSQGRVDTHFDDRNEQLVARLMALHPKVGQMHAPLRPPAGAHLGHTPSTTGDFDGDGIISIAAPRRVLARLDQRRDRRRCRGQRCERAGADSPPQIRPRSDYAPMNHWAARRCSLPTYSTHLSLTARGRSSLRSPRGSSARSLTDSRCNEDRRASARRIPLAATVHCVLPSITMQQRCARRRQSVSHSASWPSRRCHQIEAHQRLAHNANDTLRLQCTEYPSERLSLRPAPYSHSPIAQGRLRSTSEASGSGSTVVRVLHWHDNSPAPLGKVMHGPRRGDESCFCQIRQLRSSACVGACCWSSP